MRTDSGNGYGLTFHDCVGCIGQNLVFGGMRQSIVFNRAALLNQVRGFTSIDNSGDIDFHGGNSKYNLAYARQRYAQSRCV